MFGCFNPTRRLHKSRLFSDDTYCKKKYKTLSPDVAKRDFRGFIFRGFRLIWHIFMHCWLLKQERTHLGGLNPEPPSTHGQTGKAPMSYSGTQKRHSVLTLHPFSLQWMCPHYPAGFAIYYSVHSVGSYSAITPESAMYHPCSIILQSLLSMLKPEIAGLLPKDATS